MSGDPITLITIGKTLFDIKSSRDQAKLEAKQYAARREAARIRALEDEAERRKQWKLQEAHNLAIQASGGFSTDSRSFLNIQDQGENLMKKDIATIRVNLAQDINQLSLAAQMAKKTRKKQEFGSWLSIGSTWYESKNKEKV